MLSNIVNIMYDLISSFTETKQRIKQDYLINLNERIDLKTGEAFLRGELENLKIKQFLNGVSLWGSLPKFYFGDNLHTLTRQGTERAIEKASDLLSLNIRKGRIYRFDVACNFIMNNLNKEYLNLMSELQYFSKSNFNQSLYYTNSTKQICFYDKISEMRKKKVSIPDEYLQYKGKVLRYELRFLKRVKQEFNKKVEIEDLYKEDFYISILNKWKEYYFKINKLQKINNNLMAFKTAKSYLNYLIIQRVIDKGLENVLQEIDSNRHRFNSSIEASRCKNQIKDLFSNKQYIEPEPLIQELDSKVLQAVNNYN